jgi:pimeloyl-ACP methyl ester carboxylesterase
MYSTYILYETLAPEAADMSTTTTITTSAGPVPVHDTGGDGPTVLLIHGLLVDSRLWDGVAPLLAAQGLRVVRPDLPLGAHAQPMLPDADLSPPGIARLIDELAGTLGLRDVTLVGNDTGGAICQMVAAKQPDWLERLVLTPCDCYENFLPPMFRPMQMLARRAPWALTAALQPLRLRAPRRLPIAFGWLAKRGIPRDVEDAWLHGFFSDRAIRRDVCKTLAGIDTADTLAAASALRTFGRPVLLAWAPDDRFFTWKYAERLLADIPGAKLERIEDSYTFTALDQPARTAELIASFVAERGPQAVAGSLDSSASSAA